MSHWASPAAYLALLSVFCPTFLVLEQRNLIPPASSLPFLTPSFPFPSSTPRTAHCLPRGLFIYGGRWGGEGRRGTGLFRFGRQQWTSVSADGLLQHMVPTCLSPSLALVSLYLSLPSSSPSMSLCLDFFAYSCILTPCLTQTHWVD